MPLQNSNNNTNAKQHNAKIQLHVTYIIVKRRRNVVFTFVLYGKCVSH